VNFEPSEDERLVAETARTFAQRVLAPRAATRDQQSIFPEAELAELARLGLWAATLPPELGGSGLGAVAWTRALIALAQGDAAVAVIASVTTMVAELIARHAVPAVAAEVLPRAARGELGPLAFALSEPHAGSDPAAMRTTVEALAGGGFVLRGQKAWITSGDRAGYIVVMARDPELGPKAFTALLVGGGSPGLSAGRPEEKMGLRGSSTVSLAFDDVEVPASHLLGERGAGLRVAFSGLDGGRIGIGAQSLGIAKAALEAAVGYAGSRVQFGAPLAAFPAIREMVAADAVRWEAAWTLVMTAAWRREHGLPCGRQAAEAKLFASECAVALCDHALQIHGGYGYARETGIERLFRDSRVTTIYEGTSEIQRLVIGRALLREAAGG
jgi:alkylation response protein AidB-like acyl-CoA dehydrogenase